MRGRTERKCTRDDPVCHVHREDQVGQTCHWERQREKEHRWHNESESVHGQIVVNTMGKEMNKEESRSVREEPVDVEQEPMEAILEQRPHDVAYEERCQSECPGVCAHALQIFDCGDRVCEIGGRLRWREGREYDWEQVLEWCTQSHWIRERRRELESRAEEEVERDGEPYEWHHIPLCL